MGVATDRKRGPYAPYPIGSPHSSQLEPIWEMAAGDGASLRRRTRQDYFATSNELLDWPQVLVEPVEAGADQVLAEHSVAALVDDVALVLVRSPKETEEWVCGERLRQDLDRHFALERGVPRPVHLAHPARAKRREDLVGPKRVPAESVIRPCYSLVRERAESTGSPHSSQLKPFGGGCGRLRAFGPQRAPGEIGPHSGA
jgi:hypothetical protein